MLRTERLRLVPWSDTHRGAFAAMNADPVVMADLGGPITQEQSDTKLRLYRAAQQERGISRWAVEDRDGRFLGYAGVMPRPDPDHPLGPHYEIGWRFIRSAWGHGYATESAGAALAHAAMHLPGTEILAMTAPDNRRSQAVVARLTLLRAPERDYVFVDHMSNRWPTIVWIAQQGSRPSFDAS
ncbi:GNAT family N-acetyltransferase [Sphingobium nicotianae]|uniref:GNAT family N-acetyltransferase n=1 Tax=Sphingobium nicotianae TaxID=2782607 RepID=A0A9X1IPY1_9SPHN|nr:GNAT family N-acetyltransferase [Sphingobium nicotianae]MBT2186314.1 GNAT family N-acetyltransferase [Sphingobium nicotianae]